MNSHRARQLAILVILTVGAGCGAGGMMAGDSGPSEDVSAPDVATVDSASSPDVATNTDVATGADSATGTDVAVGMDVVIGRDVAVGMDTVTPPADVPPVFADVPSTTDGGRVTDCSRATVAAAIAAAPAGSEVFLDCAGATWASEIEVTRGITLRGRGPDATTIRGTGDTILRMRVTSGDFRLTGVGFAGTPTGSALAIDGTYRSLRVDHCRFTDLPSRAIIVGYYTRTPAVTGVFDHITFSNTNDRPFMLYYGDDGAWNQPDDFGTGRALYIEDSSFSWPSGTNASGGVCDGEHGARFVIRHNDLTNGQVLWHDTGSTQQARSTRLVEIYANTFRCTRMNCGWGAIGLRGGTQAIYDNTISVYPNGFENASVSQIYRVTAVGSTPWPNRCDATPDRICSTFRSHCSGGTHRSCEGDWECAGAGSCVGPCASDAECPAGSTCLQQMDGHVDASGWPCRDQTGRGQDNVATNTQASSPVYWWNNRDQRGAQARVFIADSNRTYIRPNRDYFEETAGFNGTAGVGRGLRSARPATCSVGVGFFATDESRLYHCVSANTWAAHHATFTYPHPLAARP